MYRIIGYNGPRTKNQNVIYDIHENKYVDGAKLTLKDSTQIDDLEITVNKKNWLFTHNHPFKTHVEVYDDNDCIFRGRLLKPTKEMKSSGKFSHTYTFESIEAYLVDSTQRLYRSSGITATDLLKHILKWHNKDVSKSHQVFIGKNDFEKSKTTHSVKIDYTTTRDALKNVLLKKFGGELHFRHEKNKNYLDYIDTNKKGYIESITCNDPIIEIGNNLKSISFEQDPSNVVTRLIPLGAEIQPKKIKLGADYTVDADGSITGATKKVHGSWRDAVKHAARLMNVSVSTADVDAILNLIRHESGGHTHAVNPRPDVYTGEHATGLLQFLPRTFNNYAVAGHKNIRNGFDSLLAGFNAPSFLNDARNWEKTRNWSPSGDPRYSKIPYKYESKSHLKTLNKWGWPFPDAGHGTFLSGQRFGYQPSATSVRGGHAFHDGLDFGTHDHPGKYVHAIHGGTVIHVGKYGGIGWAVVTKSLDGYQIVYQEAFANKSSILVHENQTIKTGQKIGIRDSSLEHLHIGVVKKPYTWWQGYSGGNSYKKWHWLDPEKLIVHGGQKGDKASSAKYYTPKKTGKRITIAKVNNGKDYLLAGKPILKTDDMIEKFGYIAKPVIFDSAKTPADLLKKAKAYLKKQEKDFNKESYKISALELPQYDKFKVGFRYPTQTFGLVLSQNKYLRITQKEIDIPNSPYNSSLEIGDKATGIADYQVETNNQFKKQIANLQNDVIGLAETVPELQTNTDDLEDKVYGDRDYSEAGIGHAKADVKFLRRDFNNFKKETKKHFTKIDKIQKDHETRIKKLESEVVTLSASVSALQSAKPKEGE